MSEKLIIVRRRKNEGKLTLVFPDGREEALASPPLPHRSDEEILAAALSDPDNPPLTPERMERMKRVPQVKVVRRALGLTQEDFASRFRIPLGTLRDWEQGKSLPDQSAQAYLTVIARDPASVMRALHSHWESSQK
jgi:putative transcriptional regulator